MQLAKRCAELVNVLRDEQQSMEDSRLREAVDELEEYVESIDQFWSRSLIRPAVIRVLLKVRKRVIDWANLNRIKSFMRQDQIATDITIFNETLDTHVTKFQIVSSIELSRQQRKMDLYRQHDQEEVKEMLRALVRNVEDLQAAVGMRDDVPALMQTIQEELGDQQPGTEEHKALRGGLNTLHNKTGILPPLTNLTGQVTKLSEHPAAEGGTADIYEGQWVGDEKVMLKAIRHVESESAVKRFRREIDIWRRLQHIHVLRFYGICYIGPRLFAVAPWADGGNLLVYLRNHPDCDRMKFLSEVALGLMYLHTFKPTIVHGDLRAANVLVSASGEALLADFGLSKILAEEEGAEVASTSLANAGSSRWMAPELFEGDTNSYSISPASDVWSFGMLSLEVLTSQPPYRQCRIDGQVIAKIIGRMLPERPERTEDMYERGLSDKMWILMLQCWSWDPSFRPQMRALAGEVRKLHVEHMRQYGVVGESNNASNVYHPSTLFQGSVWATPPGSANSLSPSSLPLQISPGVHESPRPYIPDLPSSPTSPTANATPRNNTLNAEEMEAFVDGTLSDEPLDSARKALQDAIREQFRKIRQAPPLASTSSGQRIKLADLDAATIAKQLMRMESDLFQKILASDCAAWVKNVADEQLLNLPRFMKNNYKIADWCQSMILFMDSNEIERRAQMITFLRRVAEECLKHRSFSTAHAIMAGLSTDFINGLGYTWRLVDKRTKDSLKQISLIVSDEDNYKSILDSDPQAPAVPILSIHLRDLRRRYKEMNTHVEVDGELLVNFQKFEEVWKSIKAIVKYKNPPPDIPKEPITAAYLEFELSKIEDGERLQQQFKTRSEELKRKEQRDFNNRRLGMEDAGFRAPKSKKK
ncbi:hypothetical protein FRC07_002890 [Ceratobasidium sp. 392]|nr:hypothetical protein FRC07_002890 [Ceratobasidium sp. 392]